MSRMIKTIRTGIWMNWKRMPVEAELSKKELLKRPRDVSIVCSSAAEYLTFVAATGHGGVEAIYADVWLGMALFFWGGVVSGDC